MDMDEHPCTHNDDWESRRVTKYSNASASAWCRGDEEGKCNFYMIKQTPCQRRSTATKHSDICSLKPDARGYRTDGESRVSPASMKGRHHAEQNAVSVREATSRYFC